MRADILTRANDIRSLKEQPFELLREIENRARLAVSGHGAGYELPAEWVGVGFRLGAENYVASRDEVREVLMVPESITRVPGTKTWLMGISNVRGHLLPLIDLRMMLGSGRTSVGRDSRIVSVNHREIPAGLLVDEVTGFRRFVDGEYSKHIPQTIARCEHFLTGAFVRAGDSWPVLDLRALIESDQFLQAAS